MGPAAGRCRTSAGQRSRTTLGLRPYHLNEIDLPLYVFETGISRGRRAARGAPADARVAPSGARRWSRIRRWGHLDPLLDFPDENRFPAQPWCRFLRRVVAESPAP